MSLNSQIVSVLKRHVEFILGSEQEMSVLASTTFIGLGSKRIFDNQNGSKNSKDESLGIYSPAYKKAKEKKYKGRDESKVNLYASGTLYGSMKQVKDNNNDTYVAVTDVEYPKRQSTVEVSNYLDKQYDEVFAPTTKESEAVIKTVDSFIIKKSKEFFSR